MKADAETGTPAETVQQEQVQQQKKKPKGSVKSGIALEVDMIDQAVILPTALYRDRPDDIMRHEEALLKEIMQMACGRFSLLTPNAYHSPGV